MITFIILILLVIIINSSFLIREITINNKYKDKIKSLEEEKNSYKEDSDRYRVKYHEVDREYDALLAIADKLREHLRTIYNPQKYKIKLWSSSVNIVACLDNTEITIKSYKFNPDDRNDMAYAINIAEEVVDKLNENLKIK